MKVAVIGSAGMAGHMVAAYLRDKVDTLTTVARNGAHVHLNVENVGEMSDLVYRLYGYDYIINCVGLLVKDSIARPDRAAVINGWFPHYLEYAFRNTSTKIVHLSTDCVFDGLAGYYKEGDPHTEMNAYGRSKSLGEINNGKDITFRMSIIGPELKSNGTGLLHWVTTNPDSQLCGYGDAWWNGITTLQLAKCIWKYMQDGKLSGVYHLVNNDIQTNKYDLLCLINEVYGLGKEVLHAAAPKPVNKILIDTRKVYDWGIPDYRTQLSELRDFPVA